MKKIHNMEILKNAGIYFVSSAELSNLPTLEVIRQVLEAGCKLFQLREKTMNKKEFYYTAIEAKKIADEFSAVFILNGNVDIAKAVNADGVHLGLDDLPIEAARTILGEDFIIGASTHNIEEVQTAILQRADYVNIGPVFSTNTKPDAIAIGLEGVERILPSVTVPYTFMGGIKIKDIEVLKAYKPAALAMITEISQSPNIKETVTQLLKF